MFMQGSKCDLWPLKESTSLAGDYTRYVNSGLTTRHMLTGSYPMRSIDAKAYWRKCRKEGDIQFSIYTKRESFYGEYDKFIGTCGLHAHRDIYKSWEYRILIFEPGAIGHGIGTEATTLVVDYAFQRLNAHRVWLGVNEMNVGAIKCYKKVGFKEEGRLRDDIFTYGAYHDVIRMGILEDEWRKRKSSK